MCEDLSIAAVAHYSRTVLVNPGSLWKVIKDSVALNMKFVQHCCTRVERKL